MAGPPGIKIIILVDVVKLHDIIIVYDAQYINYYFKKDFSGSASVSKKLDNTKKQRRNDLIYNI
jgi:hypothetical protein